MVLKKCNICDRRFKKTEHFKRHERSHTKEKPYECNICHKRFSRSDVLSRHAKGHNAASSSATNGVVKTDQHHTSTTHAYDQQHSHVNGNGQFIPSINPSTNPVDAQQAQTVQFIPREISLTTPDRLPSSSLDCLADISAHQARTQTQLNPMVMDHQQAYLGWGDVSAAEPSPFRAPVFVPVPNDILQFWLEPRADTTSNPSPIDLMRDASVSLVDDQAPASPRARQNGHPVENPSIQSPSNIPSERFAKVQRYWLTPTNNTGRLMNTLWRDVASCSLDNILGVYSGQPFNGPSGLLGDSRYGLDEECRQNLLATFGQARRSTSNDASNAPRMSEAPFGSPQAFPPAEILDMALDLYLRNFQPLVPFVHIPTFSAKRTRSPVLYVMCMIGMIILGTKGTTSFVSKNFDLVLDRITDELAKCAAGSENPVGTVSTFAAAFLFLNLAAMTGEKEHIAKSQMLYINLMTIAQRHGLFAATEGQILDMSLYEAIPDVNARWKAWSKVELIIGLLLLDSWYSSFLSTSPIIVPDAIQFILPCDGAIFDAKTAMHWMQLISMGKQILMPTVVAPSENVDLPALDNSVDGLCMHGVLAMVQLRLCEAYHRLLSNRANYPFAPCHTYAMDGRARCLPTLQLQIADKYREALERLNPNAVVMWHNMCMTLTADIQIFELAAGRSGPLPARKALDDIAIWSQTPAARRSCLHAAQIYKAMINRKASDHTMFHSMLALFTAALVLGLYTFMAPRPPETTAGCISVELLDDVDWQQVGREGFTSFMEPRGNHAFTASDNSAVNFIRNGGTLYLRGIPVQGGYQSARRILLDYAGLLKDSGKWSVRKFSHVLHIMSDVLMDIE
ncbi:hypothetical protein KXW87_000779 [Aspergillus fumigatus]|nr:hypothetical protein KXX15_009262 [Aspergillus fumigatus]KAH2332331.1 hypothetical protein KXW87_000779 [Aspergillus fumigatus]